jgi:hypothetical protein
MVAGIDLVRWWVLCWGEELERWRDGGGGGGVWGMGYGGDYYLMGAGAGAKKNKKVTR